MKKMVLAIVFYIFMVSNLHLNQPKENYLNI